MRLRICKIAPKSCPPLLLPFIALSESDNAKVSDNIVNTSDAIHFNIILILYRLYKAFAMVNVKKIQDRIKELNVTKAQLITNSGLTRVTIDKILKGGEVNVSTLEALAKGLGVNVGFFFDDIEEVKESATSGNGGASATGHGHASVGQNQEEHDELIRLREEVKYLKQMLAERDETISESRKLLNHFIGQG